MAITSGLGVPAQLSLPELRRTMSLRRLIAIDLKLGRFRAAYKGQMELYLRWLEKYETRPGEEPPIGLILCSESSREHVELLQLERSGIRVAEFATELPLSAMEARLRSAAAVARRRADDVGAETARAVVPALRIAAG